MLLFKDLTPGQFYVVKLPRGSSMLNFLDSHLAHHIQQQIIVLFAGVLSEHLHIVDNFDEIAIGQLE